MRSTLRIGPSLRRPAPLQPARLHHDLARILRRSRPLLRQAAQDLLAPSNASLARVLEGIYGS